jgi:hypothetical protein
MRFFILVALLLLVIPAYAQHSITGKVIDIYRKQPVVKASVFLSNTTVGGTTGEDGSYTLTNVKPGQYDMIISAVGYETVQKTILVNGQFNIPYTELTPKTITLNAVVVKPDPEREQNYKIFKEEFYGPTPFASQCKILNPEILDLDFDRTTNTLTAKSSDYLIIENKALGYRLRYQLITFIKDFRAGSLFYQGNVLFEPLQGKPAQMRKWYKNRLAAYQGSCEHYLRSVIGINAENEGFKTLRLMRKPNPQRPADSLIQAKIKQFSPKTNTRYFVINDSLRYWNDQRRLPKTVDYLVTKPLRPDSLVKRTNINGLFALSFNDILYVLYTKKKSDNSYSNRPLNAPDNLTSTMTFKEQYAFFDNNGVIANAAAVTFEGNWGTNRIAKLLPIDYDPKEKDLKK